MEKSRNNARAFTRKRKLGFVNTVLLSLNFVSRPLGAELNNYFINILREGETVQQQSFSEARQNIKYEAFREIFELSVNEGLAVEDATLYEGLRVVAIDGSLVQLKTTQELIERFGGSTPAEGKAFARMSVVYDVLNDLLLDARLEPYSVGERELALKGLENVGGLDAGRLLVLMDRGYWSPKLISRVLDSGNELLMRIPNDVTAAVSCGDTEITVRNGGKTYGLRCARFTLPSGETETVVTSLPAEAFPESELFRLYSLRWGVETKYDAVKNILKLDTITSRTHLTVMQDFYATMAAANAVAFAGYAAQEEIDRRQEGKDNKYAYKANRNSVVAALKDTLIAAIVLPTRKNRRALDRAMNDLAAQRPVPIRPDRSTPRAARTTARRKSPKRSVL